jgi:hypothetical protein
MATGGSHMLSPVSNVAPAKTTAESYAKWTHCFSLAMDTLAQPLLKCADG